ncbi:MAG: phosphodiesterase [Alphaproteobacteria bacterium]
MIIAQITDFHCPGEGGRTPPGFDPAADLAHAVGAVNALDPQPDLVIATGDLTDLNTPEEYARVADLLRPLKAPLMAIPGNHDDKAPLVEALAPIARTGPAAPFVNHAEIWQDDGFGPVKIILLDSQAPKTVGGVMCAARLAWLAGELARDPDLPTVIAMHHPPIKIGIVEFDGYGFEGLEAFRTLMDESPRVDLIMCGHIHRALTGRAGRAPVVVSPSVTYSYPLELRPGVKLARKPEPPGFMLHVRTGPRDWTSHVQPLTPRP